MDISKPTQISFCDRTQNGLTCQRWDQNWPHTPNYKPIVDQHNHCASPDGDEKQWCYTTDPKVRWDYCYPNCGILPTTTTTTTTTSPTPKPTQINRTVHHHMIIPQQCGLQNSSKLKFKISRYSATGYCWSCKQSVSLSVSRSYNSGSKRSLRPTGWRTSLPEDEFNHKIYYADDKATSFDFPWFVRVGTGYFGKQSIQRAHSLL